MTSETAIITGGSGSLADELARCLRDRGVEVLDPNRSELDVKNSTQVKDYITSAGDVDLLICNAGLTLDKPLAKMSEQNWQDVMDVNLKGAFLCAREASRGMVKRRRGHIIFISSFSAIHPPVGQVNYAAAKSALLGVMKSMASELGGRNIRVNAILPGFLETKMTDKLSETAKEQSLSRHTLGRFNTPQAVGEFITCLHQKMPHTSGQVFNLDSRIL